MRNSEILYLPSKWSEKALELIGALDHDKTFRLCFFWLEGINIPMWGRCFAFKSNSTIHKLTFDHCHKPGGMYFRNFWVGMCRCDPGTLTYTRATILDKINGKPRPRSSPNQEWGKLGVFAFRAPLSLIRGGWGFAVPFYFVQDCSSAEFCYPILE